MAENVQHESIQDISALIKEVVIRERISKKTNMPYKQLVIKLVNDYPLEYFVDRSELKLLELLYKTEIEK